MIININQEAMQRMNCGRCIRLEIGKTSGCHNNCDNKHRWDCSSGRKFGEEKINVSVTKDLELIEFDDLIQGWGKRRDLESPVDHAEYKKKSGFVGDNDEFGMLNLMWLCHLQVEMSHPLLNTSVSPEIWGADLVLGITWRLAGNHLEWVSRMR